MNKQYRSIGTYFHGKSHDGKLNGVFVDNSQEFPDHLYFVADQTHLHRSDVVKLRDFLTDWLERDPDADLIEKIAHKISAWDYSGVNNSYTLCAKSVLELVREYEGENP